MFFKNILNGRKRKNATLIEMVIVAIIIVGIIIFVLNKIVDIDILSPEKNIPGHLKSFASSMKLIKENNIDSLKAVSFKNLFEKGDGGANAQGFDKIIANCGYEPTDFKTKETLFGNKFRVASVGPDLADNVPTSTVASVRSVLSKLGSWKTGFIFGKKGDLIEKNSSEYNSIGNYVYIVVVEHSKAGEAEFFGKGATGEKKYYNVVMLDSEMNIYDGVSSKALIRSIFTNGANATGTGDGGVFDQLTELSSVIQANFNGLGDGGSVCIPDGSSS